MTEACDLSAHEARRLIGRKALSPVELLDSCLTRIGQVNHAVNAVVALDESRARATAKAAEAAVLRGDALGPLHGLPVGIKDLDDTEGLVTTYGSPLFADHVPKQDLGVVARLRAAGAVILAKTNTPEWGAGANTRNTVYGVTGNPFDPTRSAAGSSGGSGVALACGMVPLCSGSDTGGSLRNPAAFNGVVGFRPSVGSVANEKRALGWMTLPVNGPMARTVDDVALMLSVIASPDARDPLASAAWSRNTGDRRSPRLPVERSDLSALRLAFSEDFGFAPTEQHIRRVFRTRIAACAPMFGSATEATPDCSGADHSFAVLRAAGFLASQLENYRSRPQHLGPNIRANVEEGLGYSLVDYAQAAASQTRLYRSWQAFFAEYDVLISPAITLSPRPWTELYPAEIDGQPTSSYYHWLALAYAVTLAGHPAISIPLGLDEAGMPFGLQIVGRYGGDAAVLSVAAAIEDALADDPQLRRPAPDLAKLAAAGPISASRNFRGWD